MARPIFNFCRRMNTCLSRDISARHARARVHRARARVYTMRNLLTLLFPRFDLRPGTSSFFSAGAVDPCGYKVRLNR